MAGMNSASDLPDDIDALKAIILAQQEQAAVHTGVIARKEDRIVRLEKLVADFKRALFGVKSEKVCPEQFELALEDIEAAQEMVHAEDEEDDRQVQGKPRTRKANRGSLPKHLPRIEEVIEPESIVCECGCERHGAQNWAILASLIETCKLNAVDPHAWLTATLQAIVNGHKQSRIDELLHWNYQPNV